MDATGSVPESRAPHPPTPPQGVAHDVREGAKPSEPRRRVESAASRGSIGSGAHHGTRGGDWSDHEDQLPVALSDFTLQLPDSTVVDTDVDLWNGAKMPLRSNGKVLIAVQSGSLATPSARSQSLPLTPLPPAPGSEEGEGQGSPQGPVKPAVAIELVPAVRYRRIPPAPRRHFSAAPRHSEEAVIYGSLAELNRGRQGMNGVGFDSYYYNNNLAMISKASLRNPMPPSGECSASPSAACTHPFTSAVKPKVGSPYRLCGAGCTAGCAVDGSSPAGNAGPRTSVSTTGAARPVQLRTEIALTTPKVIGEPVELQIESLTPFISRLIFGIWYLVLVTGIVLQAIVAAQWESVNICGQDYPVNLRHIDRFLSECANVVPMVSSNSSSSAAPPLSTVQWRGESNLDVRRSPLRRFPRLVMSFKTPPELTSGAKTYATRILLAAVEVGSHLEVSYKLPITCVAGKVRCDTVVFSEDVIITNATSDLLVTLVDVPQELAAGANESAVAIVFQKASYTVGMLVVRYFFLAFSLAHTFRFIASRKYSSTLYEQQWIIVLQLSLFWYLNPFFALNVFSNPLPTALAFLEYRFPTYYTAILLSFMFSVISASMSWKVKQGYRNQVLAYLLHVKNIYDPPRWTKLSAILYIFVIVAIDVADAAQSNWKWEGALPTDSGSQVCYWLVYGLLLAGAILCLVWLWWLVNNLGVKPYLDSRPQQLACRVFAVCFVTAFGYYVVEVILLLTIHAKIPGTLSKQPFSLLSPVLVGAVFTNIMTVVYTTRRRSDLVPVHPRDQRWKTMVWPDTWYRWLARHGGSQYIFFSESEEVGFNKIQYSFRMRQATAKRKRQETAATKRRRVPRPEELVRCDGSEVTSQRAEHSMLGNRTESKGVRGGVPDDAANQERSSHGASHETGVGVTTPGDAVGAPSLSHFVPLDCLRSEHQSDEGLASSDHPSLNASQPALQTCVSLPEVLRSPQRPYHSIVEFSKPKRYPQRTPGSDGLLKRGAVSMIDLRARSKVNSTRKSGMNGKRHGEFHGSHKLDKDTLNMDAFSTIFLGRDAAITSSSKGLRGTDLGDAPLPQLSRSVVIRPKVPHAKMSRRALSANNSAVFVPRTRNVSFSALGVQHGLTTVTLSEKSDSSCPPSRGPSSPLKSPIGPALQPNEQTVFKSPTRRNSIVMRIRRPTSASGAGDAGHDGEQAPTATTAISRRSFSIVTRRSGAPHSGVFLPPDGGNDQAVRVPNPSWNQANSEVESRYIGEVIGTESSSGSSYSSTSTSVSGWSSDDDFGSDSLDGSDGDSEHKGLAATTRPLRRVLRRARRTMGALVAGAERNIVEWPVNAFDNLENHLVDIAFRPFQNVGYLPFFNLETAIDCYNLAWEAYGKEDADSHDCAQFGLEESDVQQATVQGMKSYLCFCCPAQEEEDDDVGEGATRPCVVTLRQPATAPPVNSEAEPTTSDTPDTKVVATAPSPLQAVTRQAEPSPSDAISREERVSHQLVASATETPEGSKEPEVVSPSKPKPLQTPVVASPMAKYGSPVAASPTAPDTNAAPPISIERYGYTRLLIFQKNDVQVIIARLDVDAPEHAGKAHRIVVSFRGTDNIENAKKDVAIRRVQWKEVDDTSHSVPVRTTPKRATVHSGFLSIWKAQRSTVLSVIEKELQMNPDIVYRVFVTGHSLGGALAVLCAYSLQKLLRSLEYPISDVTVYTFGQPRIGNRAFQAAYNKAVPRTFRVVNESDVVVSMTMFGGFHVGIEVDIDRNGNYVCKPTYIERSFRPTKGKGFAVVNHLMTSYGASLNAIAIRANCPARCLQPYPIVGDEGALRVRGEDIYVVGS